MSSLTARIQDDLKTAMKARDSERLAVIRALKTAFTNAAIEKGGLGTELDDAEAMAVIRKQLKQRQDSASQFKDAGRDELAAKEEAEIGILEDYLPTPLSAGGNHRTGGRRGRRDRRRKQGRHGQGDEARAGARRRPGRRAHAFAGGGETPRLMRCARHHRRRRPLPADGFRQARRPARRRSGAAPQRRADDVRAGDPARGRRLRRGAVRIAPRRRLPEAAGPRRRRCRATGLGLLRPRLPRP